MKQGYDLPLHVAEAVKRELGPEKVLWVGAPNPAAAFRSALVIYWFAIPWCVITFAWEAAVLAPWFSPWLVPKSALIKGALEPAILMALWGLPFVAVGALMLATPWIAAHVARNQAHVVTQHRVATLTARPNQKIEVSSTNVTEVTKIERRPRRDGWASLDIHRGMKRDSEGDTVPDYETWAAIPDIDHVEALILKVRADRRAEKLGNGSRPSA